MAELFEPDHEMSPTAHLLDEMALYGYRPFSDEADPRPLPEERIASGAVADMFDALIATMLDTRLEPDLEDLCWSLANLFHRAQGRIGIAFAAPAAVAGYHAVHGIATATMPQSAWQPIVSLLGAAIIAAASWTQWSGAHL